LLSERARAAVETVFCDEGRRVFATLIRRLFDPADFGPA